MKAAWEGSEAGERYMQVVNAVCSTARRTVVQTDLEDAGVVRAFREYQVGSAGANYSHTARYTFTQDDFNAVTRAIEARTTPRVSQPQPGQLAPRVTGELKGPAFSSSGRVRSFRTPRAGGARDAWTTQAVLVCTVLATALLAR